jgi:hypothetical protein
MMIDEDLARIRAHRNNIARFPRLLSTELTDLERSSIERRLAEERSALTALASDTFPLLLGDGKKPEKPASAAA